MTRPDLPVEYLLHCSRTSLQSFLLVQLGKSANSRKALRKALDEWVEARAMVLLTHWFTEHGAELLVLASQSGDPEKLIKEVTFLEPKPDVTKQYTFQHWRSEQRYRRKRA